MSLDKNLVALGLSPKEANVYLTALEIGPTTAQILAKGAMVNRPTTYVMIESLTKRGLMSSFEKGKKRYFIAESPERLQNIFHLQRKAIDEREHELHSILPELRALSSGKEKPRVRFYEGLEGLEAMREDLLKFKDLDILSVFALEDTREILHKEHTEPFRKKLLERQAKNKYIYTSAEAPSDIPPAWEGRRVPSDIFPFHGEITIYGDRVAMLSYKGKLIGVIIENHGLAETMRSIFNLAWIGAEKFSKK